MIWCSICIIISCLTLFNFRNYCYIYFIITCLGWIQWAVKTDYIVVMTLSSDMKEPEKNFTDTWHEVWYTQNFTFMFHLHIAEVMSQGQWQIYLLSLDFMAWQYILKEKQSHTSYLHIFIFIFFFLCTRKSMFSFYSK